MKLYTRKKASQERSKFTVDSILKGAWEIFGSSGDKATMTKIAERSGVSVGSIYQYFPSVDAIILSLMEHVFNGKIKHIDEILKKHADSPLEIKIRTVIEYWVNCSTNNTTTPYFAKKFLIYGEHDFLTKADARLVEVFKKHLHQNSSELRKQELDLPLLILVQTIRTVPASMKMFSPQEFDPQKCIDELTDLTLNYLKKS